MRTHLCYGALLVAMLSVSSPALAQRRMPHADANAIGGEIGIFVPRESGMGTGLDVGGIFEHYIDARSSIRVDVSWMQAKQSNDSLKSVREVLVGGDLIHNWEGGQIHPFVGAGLGAYFLQPRNNGSNDGSGSTQFGGSILGGIEFFTSKTIALKAEGRYHIVTKWNGYDPSGFSLTIGLKSYF